MIGYDCNVKFNNFKPNTEIKGQIYTQVSKIKDSCPSDSCLYMDINLINDKYYIRTKISSTLFRVNIKTTHSDLLKALIEHSQEIFFHLNSWHNKYAS
ncbi:MAG: hypothetical protein KDD45_07125 [Bdellovibrionales bacterium]|nr:hypothetical protein [Bdellovibrionales bacterium]